MINETFGSDKVWRAHPINRPVRLRAGQTGPLEITFFLKNMLPQTFGGIYGKLRVDIYPPIPAPSITNGKFACYFY